MENTHAIDLNIIFGIWYDATDKKLRIELIWKFKQTTKTFLKNKTFYLIDEFQ